MCEKCSHLKAKRRGHAEGCGWDCSSKCGHPWLQNATVKAAVRERLQQHYGVYRWHACRAGCNQSVLSDWTLDKVINVQKVHLKLSGVSIQRETYFRPKELKGFPARWVFGWLWLQMMWDEGYVGFISIKFWRLGLNPYSRQTLKMENHILFKNPSHVGFRATIWIKKYIYINFIKQLQNSFNLFRRFNKPAHLFAEWWERKWTILNLFPPSMNFLLLLLLQSFNRDVDVSKINDDFISHCS